jgi:hypothetical protein
MALFCLSAFVCFSPASAEIAQIPIYELHLDFDPAAERCSIRAIVQPPSSAIGDVSVRFDITNSDGPPISIDRITGNAGRKLDYRVGNDNRTLEVDLGEEQEKIVIEYSFRVSRSSSEQLGYYLYSGSPLYPDLLQANGEPFTFSDYHVRLNHYFMKGEQDDE